MITVYHILPSISVGGIESMVVRFMHECPSDIDYRLIILSNKGICDIPFSKNVGERIYFIGNVNSPLTYFRAARKIAFNKNCVIISSTWRAAIVVWLAKKMHCIPFHVAFTHRSSAAHFIDRICRTWQVKNSVLNLADSEAAANWVISVAPFCSPVIIHPVFAPPKNFARWNGSELRICYIGRLAPVKNIDIVCRLADKIREKCGEISFDIFGPDAGSKYLLESWINTWRQDRSSPYINVQYRGVIAPDAVHSVASTYHFILSCSHTEGFAMSIAESMQVGVVPVVGDVGGPKSYCNSRNSIVLADYSENGLESGAERVSKVWSDKDIFNSMSECAALTFGRDCFFSHRYIEVLRKLDC